MKKIVYIAHPISGNVEENLADLCRILRIINLNLKVVSDINLYQTGEDFEKNLVSVDTGIYDFSNVIPQAPYYADIIALNDSVPEERTRGIENDIAMINTGIYDELWLTGNRISYGMSEEALLFHKLGKPIVSYIGKL